MIRCPACGSQSPDWAEFCHHCGHFFSEGLRESALADPDRRCESCGAERVEGSTFCNVCGHPFGRDADPTTAKLLAVLPGFLYIYGLGHIYLRRYLKGGLLLAISVLNILLIALMGEQEMIRWGILLFDLAIFIWQTSDVYRIVREQGH